MAGLSGHSSAKPHPRCWTPIYSSFTSNEEFEYVVESRKIFPLSLHSYQLYFYKSGNKTHKVLQYSKKVFKQLKIKQNQPDFSVKLDEYIDTLKQNNHCSRQEDTAV